MSKCQSDKICRLTIDDEKCFCQMSFVSRVVKSRNCMMIVIQLTGFPPVVSSEDCQIFQDQQNILFLGCYLNLLSIEKLERF